MITDNQHDANMLQEQRFANFERATESRIESLSGAVQTMSKSVSDGQQNAAQAQEQRFANFEKTNEQRFSTFEQTNEQKLEQIRQTMERRLAAMQQENSERLEKMQEIVDEKLQKTLETRIGESFRLVSNQLEQVYKGLGEMQSVAAGVTDLKKVLSNVKTRGILGEMQLGAILAEILSPEQYDTNVATKAGSRDALLPPLWSRGSKAKRRTFIRSTSIRRTQPILQSCSCRLRGFTPRPSTAAWSRSCSARIA